MHTWESCLLAPGLEPPSAPTRPGLIPEAASAQVRRGLSSSRSAPPLGHGFGFRVQTGLHSTEEARLAHQSRRQSHITETHDASLQFQRSPRGAPAGLAMPAATQFRGPLGTFWSPGGSAATTKVLSPSLNPAVLCYQRSPGFLKFS